MVQRSKSARNFFHQLESRCLLSVTPAITFMGTPGSTNQIVVGQALHVDGLTSSLGTAGVLDVHYKWEFGDTTSGSTSGNPNVLPGFNAAHVYDTAGTYTVKLTITDVDGSSSFVTKNIQVNSISSNIDIYVDANVANDSGNGQTAGAAVKTITRVRELLNSHKTSNADRFVTIKFQAGDTFVGSEWGTSPDFKPPLPLYDSANYHNVIITSYDESETNARPILQLTATNTARAFIGGNASCTNIRIENVQFTSTSADAQGYGHGISTGGGDDWVIRDVNVPDDEISYFVQGDTSYRVFLGGNTVGRVAQYSMHLGKTEAPSSHVVVVGNTFAPSAYSNNTRTQADHVLYYGNDFTNTFEHDDEFGEITATSLRVTHGDYVYLANNIHHGGNVAIAPVFADTEVNYLVLENSTMYNEPLIHPDRNPVERISLDGPMAHVVLRNNVIEYSRSYGLLVKSDGSAPDIRILHNTFVDMADTDGLVGNSTAIRVQTTSSNAVVIKNNLHLATHSGYTSQSGEYGIQVISSSVTSSNIGTLKASHGNVLYQSSGASPSAKINHAYTSNATAGDRSIDQWNSLTAGSASGDINDYFETVGFDDQTYMPDAGDADVTYSGVVLFDIDGNPRPQSGNVTAGAFELNGTITTPYFQHQDVGSPATAGAVTVVTDGEDYNVTGAGTDIAGTSDQFHYAHRSVMGDFDFAVRVNSFTPNGAAAIDYLAKAGLMARVTANSGGSRYAAMFATPATTTGDGFKFIYRPSDGAATPLSTTRGTANYSTGNNWVRLRRIGQQVVGYISSNGTDWTLVSSYTFSGLNALPTTISVGLAVTSRDVNQSVTVQFRDLTETPGNFGTLSVVGSSSGDTISISTSGSTINVDPGPGNAVAHAASSISSLSVDASGGNDTISVGASDKAVALVAGTGVDSVTISNGTVSYGSSDGDSLTVSGGTLALSGNQEFISLAMTGGTATFAQNGSHRIYTQSLSMSGSAKLDLRDNDMIIDYTGSSPIGTWNGSAYTGIEGYVDSGRGEDGAWTGAGIVTSMTDATTGIHTTLAINEASTVLGLSGTQTASWAGRSVDATAVLIKYTYGGDADLTGEIDGDDYFYIDANAVSQFPGYRNGDFDYDGDIDGDDYFIIDSNALNDSPAL